MSETALNALMPLQADEACGARELEGRLPRARAVHHGQRAHARDPAAREGSYFLDGLVARWGRADAALAAAITYNRDVRPEGVHQEGRDHNRRTRPRLHASAIGPGTVKILVHFPTAP